MPIPTNEEILTLLDRLDSCVADDLENQWLEFKPWTDPKDDRRTAEEYAVCFANAEGGVIVFGIADRTKGRSDAIHGVSRHSLDSWRRDIYQNTKPNLTVSVEELDVPEGTKKLLIVRVPKGDSGVVYGTIQGLYKKRIGKNCMPLDPEAFIKAKISAASYDWSGNEIADSGIEDVDKVEIARARNILKARRPASDLAAVSEEEFLKGLGAMKNGKLTNTGMLLLGTEDKIREYLPQAIVHYTLQVSETEVRRNDLWHQGLLKTIELVEQAFIGPVNPEQEISDGLFKIRVPAFSLDVVREAVLNAVTHRDYSNPGKVFIRHTGKELVITNPGGFPPGITPANILRHEPVSRNPSLAHALLKLGLVEASGIGRRRIFIPTLSFGKRMPEYESDSEHVTLRIYDGSFDARMAKLVANWTRQGREIGLDGLLILLYLKENQFIDTITAGEVLQISRESARSVLEQFSFPKTGILERKGKTKASTFHLTKAVAKDLLGKAAYTKTKGLNPIRYTEMIRAFVDDHGSISPAECRELLGLGESQSSRVEISRLLAGLSGEDGFLKRVGVPPKVRYFPRVTSVR